jgi:hypothetical protein
MALGLARRGVSAWGARGKSEPSSAPVPVLRGSPARRRGRVLRAGCHLPRHGTRQPRRAQGERPGAETMVRAGPGPSRGSGLVGLQDRVEALGRAPSRAPSARGRPCTSSFHSMTGQRPCRSARKLRAEGVKRPRWSYIWLINQTDMTATTTPSTGNPTRKATSSRHTGSRTRKNFGRGRFTTKAVSATSSSSFTQRQIRAQRTRRSRCGRAPAAVRSGEAGRASVPERPAPQSSPAL